MTIAVRLRFIGLRYHPLPGRYEDLYDDHETRPPARARRAGVRLTRIGAGPDDPRSQRRRRRAPLDPHHLWRRGMSRDDERRDRRLRAGARIRTLPQIGRAPCRERVCQAVSTPVVAEPFTQKTTNQ